MCVMLIASNVSLSWVIMSNVSLSWVITHKRKIFDFILLVVETTIKQFISYTKMFYVLCIHLHEVAILNNTSKPVLSLRPFYMLITIHNKDCFWKGVVFKKYIIILMKMFTM